MKFGPTQGRVQLHLFYGGRHNEKVDGFISFCGGCSGFWSHAI